MSSTAKSWLSELDQCIATHGGVSALAESDASSERAVFTLRQHVQDHIDGNGESAALPDDIADRIPVGLPNWVPKVFKTKMQEHRIGTPSQASSSRKAAMLAKRVELLALAKEARLAAELEEMENDEKVCRASSAMWLRNFRTGCN